MPAIQITKRDLEILRQVAEHRFLRSTHIRALVAGSERQIVRRLQSLYHHGYLERPRAQLDYYHRAGSKPIVYGLGSRGAGRLRRDLEMPFSRMDWTGKNQMIGRIFLEHALMVSDFMVALELACRASGIVRLVRQHEIPLPAATSPKSEPFKWTVTLPGQRRVGVVPDQAFALESTDPPAGQDRTYFFLEADRGTMPVIRSNLKQSSFFRKMLAYEATWTQGLHRSKLGFHRLRVLTVTSSPERVGHLRDACRNLERGHGLFLFLEAETAKSSPDLLSEWWQGVNEMASLLPARKTSSN